MFWFAYMPSLAKMFQLTQHHIPSLAQLFPLMTYVPAHGITGSFSYLSFSHLLMWHCMTSQAHLFPPTHVPLCDLIHGTYPVCSVWHHPWNLPRLFSVTSSMELTLSVQCDLIHGTYPVCSVWHHPWNLPRLFSVTSSMELTPSVQCDLIHGTYPVCSVWHHPWNLPRLFSMTLLGIWGRTFPIMCDMWPVLTKWVFCAQIGHLFITFVCSLYSPWVTIRLLYHFGFVYIVHWF